MAQSLAVQSLDHLVLTVADIAATTRFYEDALGMVAERFVPADGTERWALTFGAQKINLHEVGRTFEPKARVATAGSGDLCFLTQGPLDAWVSHFEGLGIAIEDGPVMRTGAQGPIRSIYVRDPDENLIEVSVMVSDPLTS